MKDDHSVQHSRLAQKLEKAQLQVKSIAAQKQTSMNVGVPLVTRDVTFIASAHQATAAQQFCSEALKPWQ